VTGQAIPRT